MRSVLPLEGLYQSPGSAVRKRIGLADVWPVLFMTVRDEIAQSRCETGTWSPE